MNQAQAFVTEPKRATDAEIARWQKVAMDIRLTGLLELLARLEQEREMRREVTKILEAVNAAIAFGLLAELRPYHGAWQGLNDSVMAALARAAKMEEDNGK